MQKGLKNIRAQQDYIEFSTTKSLLSNEVDYNSLLTQVLCLHRFLMIYIKHQCLVM